MKPMELIRGDLPSDFATTVRVQRSQASASNAAEHFSNVHLGSFVVPVDEPVQRGGTGKGPPALGYVLAGFVGSLGVSFHLVASGMGFDYAGISIDAETEFDNRGRYGVEGVKPFFQVCRARVSVQTTEPDERLEEAVSRVRRTDPVSNLLIDAGVAVTIDVRRL